jgi:hypothetical protein
MIEHVDVEQLAGRDDLASYEHIFRAGGWVAGGVIVDDDQRRAVALERLFTSFKTISKNRLSS